ncbi:MAG: RagB/SusD family nutrient uptake outer membrane protein [Bernardetiaceae bacterium]|nr:RagB/SusD family nutrient uptake outer membrane protein [Bernardetiaceae bacterium]
MKTKTNYKSFAQLALAGLVGGLLLVACGRSFLDTTNPNALTTDNFPTKLEDLDLLVMDNYGRLRNGFYDAYPQARVGYGVTHYADQGYSDNDFNAGCQIAFNSNSNDVRDIWAKHYENVGKANATLAAIERYRTTAPNLSEANRQLLNWREGEIRFIRAWNYYWLVNFFGETSFTTADAGRLGVPIITRVANSLTETQVRRATLGETWNFITSDLRRAETLLAGKTWEGGERARVGIWAVKGFLGKVYTYNQKWDSAKIYLKEVIDRSGKRLVPYATYRDMFNSNNRPNEETLFEINYNPTPTATRPLTVSATSLSTNAACSGLATIFPGSPTRAACATARAALPAMPTPSGPNWARPPTPALTWASPAGPASSRWWTRACGCAACNPTWITCSSTTGPPWW